MLILTLVLVGAVLLWLVNAYIAQPPGPRVAANIILGLCEIIWLLMLLGVIGVAWGFPHYAGPHP